MKLKVTRIQVWRSAIDDRVGGAADRLAPLAKAGADLEFVFARRTPEQPGAGVVYVAPVKGAKAIRAAKQVGFSRPDDIHFLRIAGTNSRFWLYLGSELLETAAGIGIAAYGVATNDDLLRGIGTGAALQGIGLFVIDVPGAGRASRYQDQVRAFEPAVSFDGRSFMASARHSF